MQGYLIDPEARTVAAVEYSGQLHAADGLPGIYAVLAVDCIDAVRIENGDAIYVDDCGLWNQAHFFTYRGQKLAGRGLVVGSTGDGYDAPPRSTLDAIAASLGWLGEVAGDDPARDPGVTVTSYATMDELISALARGR